jgi:hypothetical protein
MDAPDQYAMACDRTDIDPNNLFTFGYNGSILLSCQGSFDALMQLFIAVIQRMLRRYIQMEQPLSGRILRKDLILRIDQDQALPHAAGSCNEFLLLLMELFHLIIDLLILILDPLQQRTDLFDILILHWMFQADMVQRLGNFF